MLSTEQISRVQDSFALVLPNTEEAAAGFYRRLFDIAPDTRGLFRHDIADQGRKLFQTLALIVDALDRLDRVLPTAESLAIRHVAYGVEERHYVAVGRALIETLRATLEPQFDRDTEAAWVAAYGLLSGAMMAAARQRLPEIGAAA